MKRVFNLTFRDSPNEPAAEIRISGPIGESFWDDSGTSARQFTSALDAIPAGRKINLRINSEGGSVQDGLEIYNAIKARSADVTAHITGYAVSIASVIPLAAGRIVTPKSALWMIHKPWSFTQGNADQLRKDAEMLDKHESVLLSIYKDKTKQDDAKLAGDLRAETWMTGEEAVAYGLADELTDEQVTLDRIENRFGYRRMPAASGLTAPPQPKEKTMNKTDTTPSAGDNPAEVINDTKAQAAELTRLIAEQRSALDAMKRERITAEIDGMVADGRIPLDQREHSINLCATSDAALNVFRALPKRVPQDAVQRSRVEVGASCGLDHVMALDTPAKRIQNMRDNWNEYRSQRQRFAPQNANTGTDSSTLLGTMLDQRTITVLQTMLAPYRAFTLETEVSMVPLQPIVLRTVTAGGTAQTDATSFEDTTNFVGTVAAVTATPHQYTSGGYITNAELNSGNKMDQWATIKSQELAQKLIGVINALIVTGTFSTDVQTIASSAFTISDLHTIWGTLAKAPTKYAILASTYLAKLFPTDLNGFDILANGAYGWAGLLANDYWTGATSNTQAFFCHPQAIAVAAGNPMTPPSAAGAGLTQSNIMVPGMFSVQRSNWFNTATRNDWFTLDVVLAAAVTDASAGRILKSA